MNGIDISQHQKGINLAAVPADFVIVKASQGASSSVYPTFKEQIEEADRLGRCIGAYHYASQGGAIPEAEKFLKAVAPYIGRAILCLDWEKDQNVNFNNPEYAISWLKYVEQKTGIKPFIYMSKSVCRQYSKVWDASYPLWCAQYKLLAPTTYVDDPWTDTKGFGPWKDCTILQYSSKGRLPGYSKNLDLDKAYITAEQWLDYAGGKISQPAQAKRPTLRKGDRNEYVLHWQKFLNLSGFPCGFEDGIYGNRTEKAVKQWQMANGLIADGIIGPKTWAALLDKPQ